MDLLDFKDACKRGDEILARAIFRRRPRSGSIAATFIIESCGLENACRSNNLELVEWILKQLGFTHKGQTHAKKVMCEELAVEMCIKGACKIMRLFYNMPEYRFCTPAKMNDCLSAAFYHMQTQTAQFLVHRFRLKAPCRNEAIRHAFKRAIEEDYFDRFKELFLFITPDHNFFRYVLELSTKPVWRNRFAEHIIDSVYQYPKVTAIEEIYTQEDNCTDEEATQPPF